MLRSEAEIGQSAVGKEFCCARGGRSKAVAGRPVGQEGLFRWKSLESLYAVWDEAKWRRVSDAGVGSVRRGKPRGPRAAGGRLGRGAETAITVTRGQRRQHQVQAGLLLVSHVRTPTVSRARTERQEGR